MVAALVLALAALFVAACLYGFVRSRTEARDTVFGDPGRTRGGWHWLVAGTTALALAWFWFSWDAARAWFPDAANELCQVAKLDRSLNPITSTLPAGNLPQLLGTRLLARELAAIDTFRSDVLDASLAEATRRRLLDIAEALEATLRMQAGPAAHEAATLTRITTTARRLERLTEAFSAPDYPGPAAQADLDTARAQPAWGTTRVEIPPLPLTKRGRAFDAAAMEASVIAADYASLRNRAPRYVAATRALASAIEAARADAPAPLLAAAQRILQRIDDGRIFPAATTRQLEIALARLLAAADERQGALAWIDTLAMPGGSVLAGNRGCTEQGSGRWLPKPSDTLETFSRLSDPQTGYKGVPLLWYRMKPVAEMVDLVLPDWLVHLVPGELPRHAEDGTVTDNLKSRVRAVVSGDFDGPRVPMPSGHIWDSLVRVVAGLLAGIVLGVPLGLFMGLSRFAKGMFDPLIELYRPIPPLAWAPVILTIFGIQDDGKIFLLFMVAFAIMVVSARTGATGTQLSKIHAAHSLGANNRQILREVILPNSLPEILTGVRIATGVCWGTLVAAEMLAGTTGLGFVENVARKQSDYEIIWVTIILMGVLGLAFDLLLRVAIRRLTPWRGQG